MRRVFAIFRRIATLSPSPVRRRAGAGSKFDQDKLAEAAR